MKYTASIEFETGNDVNELKFLKDAITNFFYDELNVFSPIVKVEQASHEACKERYIVGVDLAHTSHLKALCKKDMGDYARKGKLYDLKSYDGFNIELICEPYNNTQQTIVTNTYDECFNIVEVGINKERYDESVDITIQ